MRGSFCRVESSADWLSSPMVMAPVEILYLFQSAFRINKLPEIPASSLQYALCDSDGPGTADRDESGAIVSSKYQAGRAVSVFV